MTIRATIDTQAQMSYIHFADREAGDVCRTIEQDGLNIDINQDGKILGIEIYGIIAIDDITDGGYAFDID